MEFLAMMADRFLEQEALGYCKRGCWISRRVSRGNRRPRRLNLAGELKQSEMSRRPEECKGDLAAIAGYYTKTSGG